MLFMHNDNLLQWLVFTNLRYLFFCITFFTALSNDSPLLAQSTSEEYSFYVKRMVNDEFKALVENIYELLQHRAFDLMIL